MYRWLQTYRVRDWGLAMYAPELKGNSDEMKIGVKE
jgi:hypothetical protein